MTRYRIGERIGAGGFGEVYKITREDDDAIFAMKKMGVDSTEEDKARFLREVRIQAKLRHKHIVPIIDHNLSIESPWFAMPMARNNLREYMSNNHGEHMLGLFRHIALGLRHAHENGVVHRDMKPENILVFGDPDEDTPYAAVSDFGLGRLITRDSPTITASNTLLGTIQYMAPEQFRDSKNASFVADIYSLGKILYEMLTGEMPDPDIDISIIPRKYLYIIQKACEREPDRRYQSVKELIDDLDITMGQEELFTIPATAIQQEISQIIEEQDYSRDRVEKLARLFLENTDDYAVITKFLPLLPDPILTSLLRNYPTTMDTIIGKFDETVSGPLPFSFCDTVADFYERVFRLTNSIDTKRIILNRLPRLGCYHNRWHVGEVFARVVSRLDDEALILFTRDILKENRSEAGWCKTYLETVSIPLAIKKSIEDFSEDGDAIF